MIIRGIEIRRARPAATGIPDIAVSHEMLSRYDYLRRVTAPTVGLEGDWVECGVAWGQSLLILCSLAASHRPDTRLWGFDSFEGFPDFTEHDMNRLRTNPKLISRAHDYFKGADPSGLGTMLGRNGFGTAWQADHLRLVKGWFAESLADWNEPISFLHIDADLYQSYIDVLSALYDQVVVGGVIAFDEYAGEEVTFPGARKAVDTFLGEVSGDVTFDELTGSAYLAKCA